MSRSRKRTRSTNLSQQAATTTESFQQQAADYAKDFRVINKQRGWSAAAREGFDLDPVRTQRRIQAAVNLRDDFRVHCEEMGLDFNGLSDRVWLQMCFPTAPGMDAVDAACHILLGAAIWILDRLKECGRFHEACALFPTDPAVYEELHCPEIHDLCHEDRAIKGTLWILQHRNDDCVSPNAESVLSSMRTMTDDYTAKDLHHQDVPSRYRFNQLMAMIPQEWADESIATYMDQYNDAEDRMLRSFHHHYARRDQLNNDLCAVNNSAFNVIRQAYDDSQKAQEQLAVMMKSHSLPDFSPADNHYDRKLRCCALHDQGYRLESNILKIDAAMDELTGRICVYNTISAETQAKAFTPEVCDIWSDFRILDPYGLCFACLYLLDNGSDFPWIYGINSNLMGFCANALPWLVDYDPNNRDVWDLIDPVECVETDAISLYNTFFTDRTREIVDYAIRFNLPQIIYRKTGYIMPRKYHAPLNSALWLDRFSIVDDPLRTEMLTTLHLIGAHANRTRIPDFAPQQMSDTPDPDALLRRIQELETDKKALRQEAYEAEKNAKQLEEELRAIQATNERTRLELADLRELVFSMGNDETVDTTPCDISFPQHTTRKILVFGGHPSWYNEIKPKLPDVRFFRQETKPDRQMIRNADEIWLQTNAISHPLYNNVTDIARAHNVPIRYFRCASATKCAEQMIASLSA